ncbi:MAG TPA: alpha/beta hydrolase [Rhizomicrobium sp.]|jgi:pimeloyl-ACP methyl ester carboxylesterase
MLAAIVLLVVVIFAGLAAMLALAPKPPAPLAFIATALDGVDFSDMPQASHFCARDGTRLAYRVYPSDPSKTAVLIHGSSGTSASMHAVARAIHAKGWSVCALSMRGHDHTGREGDIAYVGQLDDDLADFMKTLPARGERVLLGFSSGGGFVLRIAGGANAKLFDRFILVSPQLPAGSPVMRTNAGGWVSVGLPRIIALSILSRFGIHAFEGLTTLRFAVAPENRDIQTAHYSFRMMRNFGPSDDYTGDLARAPGPVALLAGDSDELFYAGKYESTLRRDDLKIVMLSGLGHMAMTVNHRALTAIAEAVQPTS